jgi:hypothetical protein
VESTHGLGTMELPVQAGGCQCIGHCILPLTWAGIHCGFTYGLSTCREGKEMWEGKKMWVGGIHHREAQPPPPLNGG